MLKRSSAFWWLIPATLVYFFLALNSLVGDSPTMDEQNHIARGLALLRTGDPRLSVEHPPLVNALSALPLLSMPGIRLPVDHPSWSQPQGWYAFADQLFWHYGHDVTRMVFLARVPIVFLGMGLALAAFRLAATIWGRPAAAVAFLGCLFDPNILAHSRYSTTDVGGAAFLLLATYLVWRLWRQPSLTWTRLAPAAIGLGLAFGSKLSNLAFIPIFIVLAAAGPGSTAGPGRRLARLAVAGILSLVVLWAVFAFEWGSFRFQNEPWTGLNWFAGPMPTFWAGIEQIVRLSEGGRPTFLLGRFSQDGFWAYFPVVFMAKTPPATLLLLPIAATWLLWRPETRGRAAFLLLPAVAYFLFSMQSALNIGYRHLLPALPFVYVLIGGLAVAPPVARLRYGQSAWRTLLAVGVAGLLVSTVAIHPHYLSYFNFAAGGPENGYNIVIDSNIDWGQDLLRLRAWMGENQVQEVKLAWFGTADPAYYGIAYQALPGLPRHFDLWWNVPFAPSAPEPGIYAISASNLWELPLAEKYVFPWFRARPPDDRVGYSILIYRVP